MLRKLTFSRFWGSRGLPEAAWKRVRKKTSKVCTRMSIFGRPVWVSFVPTSDLCVLLCAHFYIYFWHRFWEASGNYFYDFEVIPGCILGSFCLFFCRCCKTRKMQPSCPHIWLVLSPPPSWRTMKKTLNPNSWCVGWPRPCLATSARGSRQVIQACLFIEQYVI